MLFCLAVHWLGAEDVVFQRRLCLAGLRLELHIPAISFTFCSARRLKAPFARSASGCSSCVFSSVFGLESPPFRIWVFLTQFVNIALLMQIARRLTGSATAGFLAALLWTANCRNRAGHQLEFRVQRNRRRFFHSSGVSPVPGLHRHRPTEILDLAMGGFPAWIRRAGAERGVPGDRGRLRALLRSPYFRKTSVSVHSVHPVHHGSPGLDPGKSTDGHYRMYFDGGLLTHSGNIGRSRSARVRDSQADWRPLWLGTRDSPCWRASGLGGRSCTGNCAQREWLALFLAAWFVIVLLPLLPLQESLHRILRHGSGDRAGNSGGVGHCIQQAHAPAGRRCGTGRLDI